MKFGFAIIFLLALASSAQAGPLVEGAVERSETGGVSPDGSLWSPSTPYKTRIDFVHSLGRDLPPAQVDGLLAYLSAPDPSLRPDREAALKNDVWNLLREQTVLPTNLVPMTIAVFRAHEQAPAILDYCIQHLGAVSERVEDPAALRDLRECLEEASRETARSYAGTALIALTHVPAPGNADRTFLLARTFALASDPAAHPAARATALQIGAEQGSAASSPTMSSSGQMLMSTFVKMSRMMRPHLTFCGYLAYLVYPAVTMPSLLPIPIPVSVPLFPPPAQNSSPKNDTTE